MTTWQTVSFKLQPEDDHLAAILDTKCDLDTCRERIQRQRRLAIWLRNCRTEHDRICPCGSWRQHIKRPQQYVETPKTPTTDTGVQTECRRPDHCPGCGEAGHNTRPTRALKRRPDPYQELNKKRKQFLSKHGPLWCQEDPFFGEDSDSDSDPWAVFDDPEDAMDTFTEDDGTGENDLDTADTGEDFFTGDFIDAEEGGLAAALRGLSSNKIPELTR